MVKQKLKFLLILNITLFFAIYLYAQLEFGVQLSPGSDMDYSDNLNSDKQKEEKPIDKYCYVLADEFGEENGYIQKLFRRGYGYGELTQLLLISRKSGKTLKQVIEIRDKGKKLREIAESNKLDYQNVLSEAMTIKQQLMELKETVNISTTTLNQPLTSSTTIYVSSGTNNFETINISSPIFNDINISTKTTIDTKNE